MSAPIASFGERRVNIFQILMHAGMVNSAASERAHSANWPMCC